MTGLLAHDRSRCDIAPERVSHPPLCMCDANYHCIGAALAQNAAKSLHRPTVLTPCELRAGWPLKAGLPTAERPALVPVEGKAARWMLLLFQYSGN